jgi:hypothetical protein
MAQVVKSNGSLTVYSLRRALGMKARKPNSFNACVAGKLKGRKFPRPPGMGGRYNEDLHDAFRQAVQECRRMSKGGVSKRQVALAEQRFLRETGRGG